MNVQRMAVIIPVYTYPVVKLDCGFGYFWIKYVIFQESKICVASASFLLQMRTGNSA